jgi:uncharacterized protein YjbJ (UPF0337 family)
LTQNSDKEKTSGGLVGKAVGKVKETIGSVTDNDDLAREGRLQQAQSDAETQAREAHAEANRRDAAAENHRELAETEEERQRLENEVASALSKRRAEAERRQTDANASIQAAERKAEVSEQRDSERSAAENSERRAEEAQIGAAQDALKLQRDARRLEDRADTVDPEENK